MIGIAVSQRQLIAVKDTIILTPKEISRTVSIFRYSAGKKVTGKVKKTVKVFTHQKQMSPRR